MNFTTIETRKQHLSQPSHPGGNSYYYVKARRKSFARFFGQVCYPQCCHCCCCCSMHGNLPRTIPMWGRFGWKRVVTGSWQPSQLLVSECKEVFHGNSCNFILLPAPSSLPAVWSNREFRNFFYLGTCCLCRLCLNHIVQQGSSLSLAADSFHVDGSLLNRHLYDVGSENGLLLGRHEYCCHTASGTWEDKIPALICSLHYMALRVQCRPHLNRNRMF